MNKILKEDAAARYNAWHAEYFAESSEKAFNESRRLAEFAEAVIDIATAVWNDADYYADSGAYYGPTTNKEGQKGVDLAGACMKRIYDIEPIAENPGPGEFCEMHERFGAIIYMIKGFWDNAAYAIGMDERFAEIYDHIEKPKNADFENEEEARIFIRDFYDRIIPAMQAAEDAETYLA